MLIEGGGNPFTKGGAHAGPVLGGDREHHGVTNRAVAAALVTAEDSLVGRTEPLDCALRTLVTDIGFELYPPRTEGVESVLEQQEFALRVDRGAPERPGVGRRPNLKTRVENRNIEVAGGSDHSAGRESWTSFGQGDGPGVRSCRDRRTEFRRVRVGRAGPSGKVSPHRIVIEHGEKFGSMPDGVEGNKRDRAADQLDIRTRWPHHFWPRFVIRACVGQWDEACRTRIGTLQIAISRSHIVSFVSGSRRDERIADVSSVPAPMTASGERLAQKLGLTDAVVIGLGSMLGAGIFAAFAPAAAAAGAGLLIGLAIAAIVAYCNATASAQLAVQYPSSGGTYIYGRERLGEWPGFIAGWGFVIGKTASCAAMALTFAAYAAPAGWEKPVAVVAVLALAAVNYFGVTRTAGLTQIIVVIVLIALVCAMLAGTAGTPSRGFDLGTALLGHGVYGILQSAALLFFAFAGFARIATMGEEVINPARTIPRAILTALGIVLVIYAVIAVVVLRSLGVDQVAASDAPLVDAVAASSWTWALPVVQVGAAAAALGALLALIAGVGRTSLAMARNGDLPIWLSGVHPRYRVPHHAEIALAVVVSILVLTVELRGAIGFSSFGVLVYYFIANTAAFTQDSGHRRFPRALQVVGALGCLVLVATLPPVSIGVGVAVLAIGVLYRLWRGRTRRALL